MEEREVEEEEEEEEEKKENNKEEKKKERKQQNSTIQIVNIHHSFYFNPFIVHSSFLAFETRIISIFIIIPSF